VDVAALHARFPEVEWHTYERWARELHLQDPHACHVD
jgi:hypothetical protein